MEEIEAHDKFLNEEAQGRIDTVPNGEERRLIIRPDFLDFGASKKKAFYNVS